MFKKLVLLVLGGLALREAQKRGYLDKLQSGAGGKFAFPASATPGSDPGTTPAPAPAPASTSASTSTSPMANGSPPAL